MKKKMFSPSLLNQNHLPNMVSRRIFGSHRSGRFITAAYKTDGAGGEGSENEAEELLKKIELRVQKEFEKRGMAADKNVTELVGEQTKEFKELPLEALREMADPKNGVMAKLIQQGVEMQQLRNQIKTQTNERPLNVREQIAEWKEKNKEAIIKIRSGERNVTLPVLNLRAVASPMTPATVNPTNSAYIGRVEVEPGINWDLRGEPTFWDFIVKGRTNAQTYVWVNKTPTEGAAAFIGPGVLKPGISFNFVTEQSTVKKIADSAKAATELLDDIDGMATFIEQELRYAVMDKTNSTLLATGVASTTTPASIRSLSVGYTLAPGTIHTADANFMDAIRAVVAQMRNGKLSGEITVFINSIDAANMDLTKAVGGGGYLLPPFVTANGRTIAGARIVEDNNIPVGYFQAAFMRFYRILMYQDFTVSWGWENDDFTRNLVTAVGEMRFHQFFNTMYTGAFVYDSFASVTAKLAPTP